MALARDGRLLGARIAADGQWRFPAAPCPPRFAAAAIAYEDRRFRLHPGVDPLAVLRAAAQNLRSGAVKSGASTLTMQVLRLSRQGRPRTFPEKAVEAVLALRLELGRSKDGIMALYAAHAPFGGNVVGLSAAAWRYFGRPPESLSWGEAALLAVLPNSPSLMHPGRNREPLRQKRDRLLLRLWASGQIDSLTAALARLEPLPDKPLPLPREAPHLLQTLDTRTGWAASLSDPGIDSDGLTFGSGANYGTGSELASGASSGAGVGLFGSLTVTPGSRPKAGPRPWGRFSPATNKIGSSPISTGHPPGSEPAFPFSQASEPSTPGLFHTTLDADLQRQVNAILLRRRPAWEGAGIRHAAVLILDTRTGAALAYAGNIPPQPYETPQTTSYSLSQPPTAQSIHGSNPSDNGNAGVITEMGNPEAHSDESGYLTPPARPASRFSSGESPQAPDGAEETRREKSPLAQSALGDFSDIINAPRSTGSLLKPFLYAAMLEAGEILPGTLVPDIPTVIAGFSAENFDRGYEGAVPARMALARSLNVPAVRMLREHGVGRFLHTLRGLGLGTLTRTADDYGLTLALGGAEGTLWELTGLYAGLAREAGRYADPAPDNGTRRTFFPPHALAPPRVAPATGPGGDPGAHPHPVPATASSDASPSPSSIGPAAAWLALQAMAEVSRPDGEQNWRQFASSRWVAWKTGTSFGFRDAWAVGVTPEFTVGVWVGNASGQGRPGMTGIQVAAPVLFEAFNLLPPTTAFRRPMASLRHIAVCPLSGMRPSPECPPGDSAWVPEAGLRTAACPYHRLLHLDASERHQVHDQCQSVAAMAHRPWFILPPSQEWFYRRRHADYRPAPPWRPDCEALARGRPRAMELLYPRAGAALYVPVELDARKGRAVFEAVHRDPGATVYWHLDSDYLGQTREIHKWAVDPGPGSHTLLLVDDKGERLEQPFETLARPEE